MVLILSITQFFQAITEVGIRQSVIQNKNGASPEFLNMAWWFQGLRGAGLYIAVFFLTPLLCQFYFANNPAVLAVHTSGELSAMVRVAFLAILFSGFGSPRAYILEKEFRFGKSMVLSQGSAVIGTVLSIVLAIVMRNVWALVIGFAASGLIGCLFSYILCPFRPRLECDESSCRELYGFARGMVGLPVLTYVAANVDVLVAGKLVPAALLGMYGLAISLAQMPRELFVQVISPILLPAFAEKQDDKEAICRAVLEITRATTLVVAPLVALGVICSKTILSIAYRPEYSVVAIPFCLLCLYVLFLTQAVTLGSVFFGIGQPEKHRIFVGFRALILIVLIYPAVKLFGLTGAAATLLLAGFGSLCVQVLAVHRVIGLKIRAYVISWLPGLVLAIPVLVSVLVAQSLKPGCAMLHLAVGTLSCIVVCVAGLPWLGCFDQLWRRSRESDASVEPISPEDMDCA
jgi:O-antigen/teichoic acid export membrane protein